MGSPRLPAGYRVRAPAPDELPAVKALSDVCDAALGSPPSITEGLLRVMWQRPRFVLATDAWVLQMGAAMVGYAQLWEEAPEQLSSFAIVHPEHLGRGLGTTLAELVEERAAEKVPGGGRLFAGVLTQDEPGARLLRARGYVWARRFWHMETELDAAPEDPPPLPGIDVRRVEPDRDLPAVHGVLDEAFRDHWGYVPASYEEFLDREVRGEDFDPTLWFVAVDDGDVVGAVRGNAHTDRGWVDELAVHRSHRGRGIGSALLRTCFAAFAERGLALARLNVDSDNPTGAVSLYERVGMHVASSFDLWELALPTAS